MAWNDKGGGPWGSPPGGNEPRRPSPSNGKGPSGKGPNDFEAMLRQGQDRLNQLWSAGMNGGRGIILLF